MSSIMEDGFRLRQTPSLASISKAVETIPTSIHRLRRCAARYIDCDRRHGSCRRLRPGRTIDREFPRPSIPGHRAGIAPASRPPSIRHSIVHVGPSDQACLVCHSPAASPKSMMHSLWVRRRPRGVSTGPDHKSDSRDAQCFTARSRVVPTLLRRLLPTGQGRSSGVTFKTAGPMRYGIWTRSEGQFY